MSKDLDYFTEFLENPSVVSLGEFYRMVREWADYIADHKNDFNYLEDDEWKEIRERLIAEYQVREEIKDVVDAKWEIIGRELEREEELSDEYVVSLTTMQMDLLKEYQDYFRMPDEMIASGDEALEKFKGSVEKAKISKENLRISEQNLEKSIVALDNEMMKVEEATGKKPQIFSYKGRRGNKGN